MLPNEHWCQHPGCSRWGSFGYHAPKTPDRWFCGEHRPDAHNPTHKNPEKRENG